MEKLIVWVVIGLLVTIFSLAKSWMEKQQREREAAERLRRGQTETPQPAPPQPAPPAPTPPVARRPVFYGRPGEERPPKTTLEAFEETLASQAAPAERRPIPAAQRPRPTGMSPARATRSRIFSPPPPPPSPEPALEAVGSLESRHIKPIEPHKVDTVEERHVRTAIESPAERQKRLAATSSAGRFFAEMFHGKNAARAIILSEVLKPPKSLEDP